MWPRWPEALRARLIGYLWDASLPVGSIHKSQKTASVTFIVVHSGSVQLGQWVTERRNVCEDDTKSSSETFIGQIRFRSGER